MSISGNNGKAIKTVDDAFKWFERNVARVPDDENADGKSVHPEVRKSVSDALAVEHHFLSGSYGRKTQAKKLKDVHGRSDGTRRAGGDAGLHLRLALGPRPYEPRARTRRRSRSRGRATAFP